MASCPKCLEEPLIATTVTSGLHALGCPTCDGILLSLVTYRAWRETQSIKPVPEINEQPLSPASNDKKACLCPKCRGLMSKYRFTSASDNQLDFCAHCQEVWFEQGEWALVNNLSLSKEITQIFTRPWQYSLRADDIDETTEARWRERFEDDFEKILTTKQWIDSHQKRTQLLAYLNQPIN